MKIRYIGKNFIPIGLAKNIVPALTNGKIYSVINVVELGYVVIDDIGKTVIISKDDIEVQ